ncbi:MAG: cytochrome P460 family protein [Deltaproteobacteria bacterium]|nr:cytochrome P460 family protein [Deltaproteobacteria bacterium]
MKRRITMLSFFLAAAFFLSGQGFLFAEMPAADPAALWNYITKVSPYKNWKFWPDHQGVQPGRAPHGPLHKVYVNDRAYNSPKPPLQYGSIQVKENYNKNRELMAITVMYKVIGYNPDDGDWFWVKYSPNGEAKPYGKVKGCIGCHGIRANNDFVTIHEFD